MEIDDDDTNQSAPAVATAAATKARKNAFFQRSDSTLCLGCPPPDPFTTHLQEALPLADQVRQQFFDCITKLLTLLLFQPHLLQPTARREEMFGVPKHQMASTDGASGSGTFSTVLPPKLGLAERRSKD